MVTPQPSDAWQSGTQDAATHLLRDSRMGSDGEATAVGEDEVDAHMGCAHVGVVA